MTQSRTVEQIKINVMTQQQYDSATKNADEFYLVTDADLLPSQVNNSGKYLTTNGSALSWATVDALPSQIDNEGKYLTTDGTDAYWTELDISSGPSNLRAGEYINIVDDPGGIGDFSVATSEVLGYGDSHGYWADLVYDGTQWVAITDSGYCKTSTDLETWSSVASISEAGGYCTGIATDGTKYIVITDCATTAISTDLASWTIDTNNPLGYNSSDCYAESIIYDGTKFVAVNQKGWVSTSSDGTTWSTYQVPGFNASTYYDSSSYWTDILYDGTQYVMLNIGGYISTSTDLTNWTTPQDVTASYDGTSGYWKSMTYVNGKLLIMHNYSADMLMSSDYENWSCVHPISIGEHNDGWNILRSGDNKVVALHKGDAISIANATGPATVISAINVQPVLQSGTNIKTINGSSILGEGDLTITSLPAQQAGYSGKVLKTNGTSASWSSITWGEISGDRNAINNRLENTPILAGDNINITTTTGEWSYSTSSLSSCNAIIYVKDRFVAISSSGRVTTSADGTTWSAPTAVSNLGNRSWTDVCCVIDTDYRLYALSEDGYISVGQVTSESITWSIAAQRLARGHGWNGIAYGNGKLVAITNDGYISTTTPANYTSWSTASYKSTLGNRSWYSIIYDGTKFIALSLAGYISTSTDGETWSQATQSTSLSEYHWGDLLYDGTQYIILGHFCKHGVYATSKDLINWSVVHEDALLDTSHDLHVYGGIAYNNNTYVILGYETGRLVTCKPNKTTISATIPDFSEDIQNLNENKQDKLIAGTNISIVEQQAEWSQAVQDTNLGNHGWQALAYDGTKFVALGSGGYENNYYSTSTDGITWTPAVQDNNLYDKEWRAMAYGDNKFVAITYGGSGGYYYSTSTDGTAWTAPVKVPSLSDYESWVALAYDGSKFVTLCDDGIISTSTDGTTWSSPIDISTALGSHYYNTLAYGNGKFVTISANDGYISTSTDGITWTPAVQDSNIHLDGGYSWTALAYDGTKFVAIGYEGYVSTSTDGTTWTPAVQDTNLGSSGCQALIYDGSKLIALGREGYISQYLQGSGFIISATTPTIATSVSASSTNAETVGAKLFYDTIGNIESLINAL